MSAQYPLTYPPRKGDRKTIHAPITKGVQVFETVFGSSFMQESFRQLAKYWLVALIVGVLVRATGHSQMQWRSLGVLLCALWLAVDVGIWLRRSGRYELYASAVFSFGFWFLCSLAMSLMYGFLASTLADEQEDVYEHLTARVELPEPGDVLDAFFVLTSGSKIQVAHEDWCGIHLIVGEKAHWAGQLRTTTHRRFG
jgi:hypothetical protein